MIPLGRGAVPSDMPTRRASCSCGQLTVEVEGDPVRVSICHCPRLPTAHRERVWGAGIPTEIRIHLPISPVAARLIQFRWSPSGGGAKSDQQGNDSTRPR